MLIKELVTLFILVQIFNESQCQRSYNQPEIVIVGAIFQSDARDSAEHVAFYERTSRLQYSKTGPIQIKTKMVYVDDISDSFQISGAICQLLVSGVVGIFGPIHPRTVHTIQSLTDSHDLLYITTSDAHHYASESIRDRRGKNIIKLRPLIANAIVDFIQAESWNRILYLYDSNEALFRLRMIFEHTNSRRVDLSADARQYSPNSSTGILQYINKKSKRFSQKRIILDLKNQASKNKMIEQMEELKMDRVDYHYLISEIDEHEITSDFIRNGAMNFTMFCPLDYQNPKLNKFLKEWWLSVDMIKKYPSLFATNVSKVMIPLEAALIVDGIDILVNALSIATPSSIRYQENSEDLICTPPANPKFTAKQLQQAIVQAPFQGISGKLQFNPSGFRYNYKLDIFEARVKKSMNLVGNWTTSIGLSIDPKTRRNEKSIAIEDKKTLRVTSILVAPFLMYKKDAQGRDTKELEGFCIGLINNMTRILKVNYTLKLVKDGQFGAFVNDSWNGMIGELMKNEADIAVAPLTITSSRERVVDFSTPFMEFGLSVMYVKMQPPNAEPFDFMKPLSGAIWMCISYAYLSVSVVLFLVSRFNPYEWGGNLAPDMTIASFVNGNNDGLLGNEDSGGGGADGNSGGGGSTNKMGNDITIFNSFWFSLSAFMQQGGDIAPRSLAGRIVGGVWWFFTLIIVSSYTANLAAYLTKERMNNPISSYEDLANQNRIKYGVVNSGSSKEFFSKSTMDVFSRMWTQMDTNQDVFMPSIKAGVERVINSSRDFAFILESTMNEYYNQRKPCKTEKIGHNLDSGKGYGIATPPGSKLRDPVNLAVLEMKEQNIIPYLKELWWKKKSQCTKENQTDEESGAQTSVKLGDIKGLFYVLTGGLVIGLLFSVLELFYKSALESRRKNKKFWTTLKVMLNHSMDVHHSSGIHGNTNSASNADFHSNSQQHRSSYHSNNTVPRTSNPSNHSLMTSATSTTTSRVPSNRMIPMTTAEYTPLPTTGGNTVARDNGGATIGTGGKVQYSF